MSSHLHHGFHIGAAAYYSVDEALTQAVPSRLAFRGQVCDISLREILTNEVLRTVTRAAWDAKETALFRPTSRKRLKLFSKLTRDGLAGIFAILCEIGAKSQSGSEHLQVSDL